MLRCTAYVAVMVSDVFVFHSTDRTLQDIVYKLVPDLQQRKSFYTYH